MGKFSERMKGVLCIVAMVLLVQDAMALRFDCEKSPASPEDRRPHKKVLRMAHWNVEWLFLDKWEKRWSSKEEAEKHLHDVAAVLRTIDADVIHVAEVEDCTVLEKLCEAIGDDTLRYYMVRGTDTSTGQNVGLLTRVDPIVDLARTSDRVEYPLEGTQCQSSFSGSYGVSKHFFTTIEPESFGRIFLMGTHLLAFPDDENRCSKREAQAAVLQGVLEQAMRNSSNHNMSYIVAGDFNDYDGSVRDVADSVPITRTLSIVKDVVQADEGDEDSAWDGDELHNVAIAVEQSNRFTAYYNPDKNVCKAARHSSTSIDHILVNLQLLDDAKIVRFDNDAFQPPCASGSQVYSDHWPIVIEIELPERK